MKEKYVSVDMAIIVGTSTGYGFECAKKDYQDFFPNVSFFTLSAAAKVKDGFEDQLDDIIEKEMLLKVIKNALAVYAKATTPPEVDYSERLKHLYNRVEVK